MSKWTSYQNGSMREDTPHSRAASWCVRRHALRRTVHAPLAGWPGFMPGPLDLALAPPVNAQTAGHRAQTGMYSGPVSTLRGWAVRHTKASSYVWSAASVAPFRP